MRLSAGLGRPGDCKERVSLDGASLGVAMGEAKVVILVAWGLDRIGIATDLSQNINNI